LGPLPRAGRVGEFGALAAQAQAKKIDQEDAGGKKKSQATLLIELAAQWEVFRDAENVGYAVLFRNGIREVWPIRSVGFKQWLSGAFFALTGKGCNGTAVSDALSTIEARAIHQGKEARVYLRVARTEDRIYLDLCDERWRVLEVSSDGWRILDASPVNFIRKRGMAPLPIPQRGGLVADLRDFLNISDGHFELVIGWIMGSLRGKGPFPVLVLQGEQGTGKSTTSRVLRAFVDPSTVPLRSPPREVRDLLVSAVNNHLVVLDNLSGLNPELSDCLCRFATGGGLDARALFTDMEQVLVDIQRPVLVNGIDDIATRPDLSERSIILNLPVIDATKRRDERTFWAEFEAKRPGIMGALLDALVHALAHESRTHLERKPRMADFAIWATAAESALGWKAGEFMRHFDEMQDEAVADGIDASPVGSTLMDLLGDSDQWIGTPTELLNTLTERAGIRAKSKAWPQSTRGLSSALKRLAPSFRRVGVSVQEGRASTARFYKIMKVPFYPSYPSQPSQPTAGAGSSDFGGSHDGYDGYSGAYPNAADTAGIVEGSL
jgi:hypothetical protein